MRHLISTFIILLGLLSQVKGQKKINFLKVQVGAESPIGFFNEGYKTGWGIHVTDYYGVADKGNILLTTGVTGWKAKGADLNSGLSITKLGYQQFVAKGLYLQADAGLGIYIGDWGGSSDFTFGGGIGYLFNTNNKGGFDISTKYNRISDRSWISLSIGYQFKL